MKTLFDWLGTLDEGVLIIILGMLMSTIVLVVMALTGAK